MAVDICEGVSTGEWLRGQTEHCMLAVRGKPVSLSDAPGAFTEAGGILCIGGSHVSKAARWSCFVGNSGRRGKSMEMTLVDSNRKSDPRYFELTNGARLLWEARASLGCHSV